MGSVRTIGQVFGSLPGKRSRYLSCTLEIRAQAYWRYGAELPSRASALSHVKVTRLCGFWLRSAYFTAPMPTARATSFCWARAISGLACLTISSARDSASSSRRSSLITLP